MKQKFIMDTGPIVAFLNRRDHWHTWIKKQMVDIEVPVLTCEPVISETMFLLRNIQSGKEIVLELLERDLLKISFRLEEEIKAVKKLIKKYQNLQMSLADACLVRMCEKYSECKLITLDTDFKIYRMHGRQVIPTIMPENLA